MVIFHALHTPAVNMIAAPLCRGSTKSRQSASCSTCFHSTHPCAGGVKRIPISNMSTAVPRRKMCRCMEARSRGARRSRNQGENKNSDMASPTIVSGRQKKIDDNGKRCRKSSEMFVFAPFSSAACMLTTGLCCQEHFHPFCGSFPTQLVVLFFQVVNAYDHGDHRHSSRNVKMDPKAMCSTMFTPPYLVLIITRSRTVIDVEEPHSRLVKKLLGIRMGLSPLRECACTRLVKPTLHGVPRQAQTATLVDAWHDAR